MKIIESDGGPLIGLSRCDLHSWSGVEGKRFIGEAAPFPNDYEAVGSAMFSGRKRAGNLAKMTGVAHEGLLIVMPLRTLIVASDDRSVYLAQIWASEAGWSSSMIAADNFYEGVRDENSYHLNVSKGGFIFFDSASPADCIGDDFLCIELMGWLYTCESSTYEQAGQANLVMIKMHKISP